MKKRCSLGLAVSVAMAVSAADDLSLPDPLTTCAGDKVTTVAQWQKTRRPELLELFRTNVYGRVPATPVKLNFNVFDEDSKALDGTAIRKQVAIEAVSGEKRLRIELLMYLPVSAKQKPVPVFVLLNFSGNHTVNPDPAIVLPKSYVSRKNSPPEQFRGAKKSRYPISDIVARGYGFATACYADIDPDFDDGFKNGAHALLDPPGKRPDDAWGSVGAWAWGLSRLMDYFETEKNIDRNRVAVLGHSRLGKTALWAGAQDERFALVISNNSGSTGAALARNKKGEQVERINTHFPHWFCENYKKFNGKEDKLPIDQHELIALMAPRLVYVASASLDAHADPENEFRACVHAGPVYELFGLPGVGASEMPKPENPLHAGYIGHHIRTGKHDLTEYDWARYMDFADKHWK
jgi:hypothetical protein